MKIIASISRRLQFLFSDNDYTYLNGAFQELYAEKLYEKGRTFATIWIVGEIFKSAPSLMTAAIYWRIMMLRNYMKIAYRTMRNSKGFSFINIAGLAVGIASCIFIVLFIRDELAYDRHHEQFDHIYRVAFDGIVQNNRTHTARSCPPLASVLETEFPEVIALTQFRNYGYPVFRYADNVFSEERVLRTTPGFFDVFTVPFIKGDVKTALAQPNAIVLTRSMAEKYFGSADPIGKTINSDNQFDYIVTAVIEDVPRTSHFHFDFLTSIYRMQDYYNPAWYNNDFYTYVVLKPGTSLKAFEEKLEVTVKNHLDPQIQQFFGISYDQFIEGGGRFSYFLQPLKDIHLHSHLEFELDANGSMANLFIFSSIALGIIVISCINFVNLSTARSSLRTKEIGIRKTVGSGKPALIGQFLFESTALSFLAALLALLLVHLFLPLFNNLAQKQLSLSVVMNGYWPIGFLGFVVLLGILSGIYPALFLTSFKPVQVLKGEKSGGNGISSTRNVLVVVQFSVSIILIIGTLIIRQQLVYVQNKNLGFQKDQIVILHKTDDLGSQLPAFKQELLANPSVFSATNTSALMGDSFEAAAFRAPEIPDKETHLIWYLMVDADFLETYQVQLISGRSFEAERTGYVEGLVLNESAVEALGLQEAAGKEIINSIFEDNRFTILGVIKDFHFESMHQPIRPLLLYPFTENQTGRYLSVRIATDHIQETLQYLEDTWNTFALGQPFEYTFFDDHFAEVYSSEERTAKIFSTLSILAIFIANLGLLGLSAYVAERRTKEIGIRKALGASVTGIIGLLVKDYIRLILIANLIAWPLGYYAMSRWLADFAYRIEVNIWVFLVAITIAVTISLLTVVYHSVKAARTSPVTCLKYE